MGWARGMYGKLNALRCWFRKPKRKKQLARPACKKEDEFYLNMLGASRMH